VRYLVVVYLIVFILFLVSGQKVLGFSMKEELAICPASPNCVSTLTTSKEHFIEPIKFELPLDQAREKLKGIIESEKRVKFVKGEGAYLHFIFTSFLFRFVDDVEFFIDEKENLLHFRSRSRVGYSDLGANRKRMEIIRQALAGRI